MSGVYSAESSIHGTGVFSSAHFSPGEIILWINDSRVVTEAEPLDPAKGEFEHHCDYLASGKVVLMQSPERFVNHRCDPNTFIRTISGDRCVVALRKIYLGLTARPVLRRPASARRTSAGHRTATRTEPSDTS
jgi:hypothetical protein